MSDIIETRGATLLAGWVEGVGAQEAARKLGVSRQAVHNWRTGRRRPGVPEALVLLRVAGVPIDAWTTEEEYLDAHGSRP